MFPKKLLKLGGNRFVSRLEAVFRTDIPSLMRAQPPVEKISNNWLFTLRDGVVYLKHHR